MSYSVFVPCGICLKTDKCSDRHFINGAVAGIHAMLLNDDHGHMGSGSVTLTCTRAENEVKE